VGIGYAYWVRLRVPGLKVDLLQIALELRQKVARLGALQDLAYQEAYQQLLSMEQLAGEVSWPAMECVRAQIAAGTASSAPKTKSSSPAVQQAVDEALEAAATRLANYLTRETISGALGALKSRVRHSRIVRQEIKKSVAMSCAVLGNRRHHSYC
jgi:hypothetical protein